MAGRFDTEGKDIVLALSKGEEANRYCEMGRFECVYCKSRSSDALSVRKNHLRGKHHQKLRNEYYESIILKYPEENYNGITGDCVESEKAMKEIYKGIPGSLDDEKFGSEDAVNFTLRVPNTSVGLPNPPPTAVYTNYNKLRRHMNDNINANVNSRVIDLRRNDNASKIRREYNNNNNGGGARAGGGTGNSNSNSNNRNHSYNRGGMHSKTHNESHTYDRKDPSQMQSTGGSFNGSRHAGNTNTKTPETYQSQTQTSQTYGYGYGHGYGHNQNAYSGHQAASYGGYRASGSGNGRGRGRGRGRGGYGSYGSYGGYGASSGRH